jgi:hypothetical protein
MAGAPPRSEKQMARERRKAAYRRERIARSP